MKFTIKWEGQQYIYLFLLIIILGFTGWFYMQSSFESRRLSPKTIASLPDIIVEDLNFTQFDTKGQPAHYFHTPKLIHFPRKNMSTFQTPEFVLTPEDQEPWTIRANSGRSEAGMDKIILLGNVILHQKASAQEKEKTIRTSELIYYTKTREAETAKKIFFEQPGLSVQSTGMKANLDKQQIYLLHQVSSIYVPDDKNQTL